MSELPLRPEQPASPYGRSTGDRSGPGRWAEAVATEEKLLVGVEARVEEEREKLAQFRELFERRHALYEEQAELRRERVLTERRIRALEQRVERERRRAERRVVSADGSRRGRPVRIDVDDEAWTVLKREAIQRRVWLVWWLGDLVRLEADALAAGSVSGPPSSRRRRSPGEREPVPRRRFLRVDVANDRWAALRATAMGAGSTVGRYVGELAEAAAYEAGWRGASSSSNSPSSNPPLTRHDQSQPPSTEPAADPGIRSMVGASYPPSRKGPQSRSSRSGCSTGMGRSELTG